MGERIEEHRISLVAGRCGLKLIRNRRRATVYCLRDLRDASTFVCKQPGGQFGLVKTRIRRERAAGWLTLNEVSQVLASWN